MSISDAGGARPVEGGPVASPSGAVSVRSVDLAAQEDAKQFVWSGAGEGAVSIGGPAADLRRQLGNAFALVIDWRVDTPPAGRVALSFGGTALDVTEAIGRAPRDRIGATHVPLRCFAGAGANFTNVGTPFLLTTDNVFRVTLASVRLEPITSADTCPTSAR
jgi:beta-glucosidase